MGELRSEAPQRPSPSPRPPRAPPLLEQLLEHVEALLHPRPWTQSMANRASCSFDFDQYPAKGFSQYADIDEFGPGAKL
jgi:hypothetical protein